MEQLLGKIFYKLIYTSVVGQIKLEMEILSDGSVSTSMFVIYPDGVSDEIFTVQEGFEKLDLQL